MKVFVSDLDGTLIDNAIKNDLEVKQCVEGVLETGNEFVIATGRTHYGVKCLDFYEQPIYFIIMNGAIILDKEKRTIYKQVIDPRIIDDLIESFSNDNVEYITENQTYVRLSRKEYIERYSKWDIWNKKMLKNEKHMEYMLSHFQFDADIQKIRDKIVKVNILELDSNKYAKKEEKILKYQNIQNNPFAEGVFEITAKGVSKKDAILKLMEIVQWNSNDIFAFGDGDNDSDMLKYFVHSYAPSNASKKAKESAHHTIGSCSMQSVVKEIHSIIQKEKV